MNLNLDEIVIYYLAKRLNAGDTMTLAQLQADITSLNLLMNDIGKITNVPVANTVVSLLQVADQDPFVQNILLLLVNKFSPPTK
jgi:hypothetical protein